MRIAQSPMHICDHCKLTSTPIFFIPGIVIAQHDILDVGNSHNANIFGTRKSVREQFEGNNRKRQCTLCSKPALVLSFISLIDVLYLIGRWLCQQLYILFQICSCFKLHKLCILLEDGCIRIAKPCQIATKWNIQLICFH